MEGSNRMTYYSFKPLSKKEIITTVKQLGLMPVIYKAYRELEWFRRQNIHNKFLASLPDSSKGIMSMLGDEYHLYMRLDEWEKKYKNNKKVIL